MSQIHFFCFCLSAGLTLSSSLGIINKQLDCRQKDLDHCKISNCSGKHTVVHRRLAPVGPDWGPEHVGVWLDLVVMNVSWTIQMDASALTIRGSEINILEESTNESICVQYAYNLIGQEDADDKLWTFGLDGVVVEPGQTYTVSVFNLPEPQIGNYRIRKKVTVPMCDDSRIQKAQICLENGSLWDPHVSTTVSLHKKLKIFSVVVGFEAAEYSETYQVSIQNHGFYLSHNVSKESGASLNVSFEFGWWALSQCQLLLKIQPFFVRCNNDCRRLERIINFCPYYPPRTLILKVTVGLLVIGCCLAYFLWRASQKGLPSSKCTILNTKCSATAKPLLEVPERKRVLIIYSLDHPLYKNIVLKLCAFLATKCGTEVVLDLLDSTRLGVLGNIQWLDWHREQIERSSDKVLILCSRGVQAKWRAMCGDKQVFLREEASSPIGDMLSPALSLMVPHFIRSPSFEKYIVAYFDGICSEEDVPSPFNITVRYKLMNQFEELFFRILEKEKQEPGRMNHIEGLSEDEYDHCSLGRALRDAIDAFHAYQLENPHWFEDELVEGPELSSMVKQTQSQTSLHIVDQNQPSPSHVMTQEQCCIRDETALYVSNVELN